MSCTVLIAKVSLWLIDWESQGGARDLFQTQNLSLTTRTSSNADKKIEYVFEKTDVTKTSLKDDALAMYMNDVLTDVKLRTNSEIFPVHKFVLSARFPVFSKDMKEIKDLDAATVRRMLLLRTVWSHLYSAACKYRISPPSSRRTSNSCDASQRALGQRAGGIAAESEKRSTIGSRCTP
ncbi:hypothetical protein TNCV_4413641 [Trichonephila clavipes]|uniref:BTB domain-containing protein n=1 Tax=Trichonephila clavipes TaxID=2585209 RepID=A0A8X6S1X8_TRICX|nr:hypothetical protein TNCV_4413641 [Trichonephila clavipes]